MRVGVAGLGNGAANALCANPGLSRHPHVRLAAGADPRPEARAAFADRFGVSAYADVEQMCAQADIDAVYVLTPNALHADHAVIAAEHGKQVIADKPMAMSMAECDAMIAAAERNGVRLLVGHSQSLDAGILEMVKIVESGKIGRPIMITSSYYSEWLYRPRSPEELDPRTLEGSLTLRQGWVQLDIVRMLAGGLAQSVRGTTISADPARPVDGAYAAHVAFANGVAATAVFDAYGHFDSSELTFGLGLRGLPRSKDVHLGAHRQMLSFSSPADEHAHKDARRIGGARSRTKLEPPPARHQFFGLTVVSCERGALRQTPDGVMIYGRDEWREVTFPPRMYTEVELDLMYHAWVDDKPLPTHDGRWGKATTELCFALLESSGSGREVTLQHQVAI